jgi:hypothetical protein
MFPVRYELNSYIIFIRNSVFKGLIRRVSQEAGEFLASWTTLREEQELTEEVGRGRAETGRRRRGEVAEMQWVMQHCWGQSLV